MSNYNHGIRILENPTSIIPPINASAGLQVVVGTAPINMLANPSAAVHKPIIAYSWKEAVSAIGYSDDWKSYTLCQSMDATFRLFNVAPIVLINVLDPEKHNEQVNDINLGLKDGVALLDVEGVLLSTIVVKKEATTINNGTDYVAAFNEDGKVLISALDGGALEGAQNILVSYKKLAPSKVTETDIIGGFNSVKNRNEGLEVISDVYPKFNLVPGILLAPGWSHKPTVAAVLDAKSEKINSNFNAINIVDIDSNIVTSYQDAPEWKSANSYSSPFQIVCFPKAKLGEKVYWLSAIHGALTQYTDGLNDDVPFKSPSNKSISINGTILGDGTEVLLDQAQANFLNGSGIVTALNLQGFRMWGNNTSAYPSTTDPKDRFIAIRRMFNWWGNTFILTYFQKVDEPGNYRLIESVVDSENIRGNGFKGAGQIAGAVMEFRKEDNPITNILNGRIQFIQKLGFFTPAEDIVNVLEFDPTILENALGGE